MRDGFDCGEATLMSAVWRPIQVRRNESDFSVGLLLVVPFSLRFFIQFDNTTNELADSGHILWATLLLLWCGCIVALPQPTTAGMPSRHAAGTRVI